ncbi:hypothetical protein ACHAXT_002748 [Thalassiosira profunda]
MNRVTRALARASAMDGGSDEEDGLSASRRSNDGAIKRGAYPPDPRDDPSSGVNRFLDASKPMRTSDSYFYSLELQPYKIRRERVVMVAEAYSIFGALFLNGVWFIWEYGNSTPFQNDTLHYAFEALCAISIICNVFLAMFGSILWILSAIHSSANPHWTHTVVHWLGDFQNILLLSFFSVFITLGIAMYNRLQENLVVAILLPVLMMAIVYKLVFGGCTLMATECPLEMWHMPRYFTYLIGYPIIAALTKTDTKAGVKPRADYLRHLADSERISDEEPLENNEDLHLLLSKAAQMMMLGKTNVDVTPYVIKLKEEWYDDVESLKGKSANALSKYMPDRLADCVCRLLDESFSVEWTQSCV